MLEEEEGVKTEQGSDVTDFEERLVREIEGETESASILSRVVWLGKDQCAQHRIEIF